MRDTCTAVISNPDSDLVLTTAALTYRRILADDGADAAEIVERMKRAVREMGLDARALPPSAPEKRVRQLVSEIGRAVIDGSLTERML